MCQKAESILSVCDTGKMRATIQSRPNVARKVVIQAAVPANVVSARLWISAYRRRTKENAPANAAPVREIKRDTASSSTRVREHRDHSDKKANHISHCRSIWCPIKHGSRAH